MIRRWTAGHTREPGRRYACSAVINGENHPGLRTNSVRVFMVRVVGVIARYGSRGAYGVLKPLTCSYKYRTPHAEV